MIGIGIVGLPNVGKSTLFNAITKTQNACFSKLSICNYRTKCRNSFSSVWKIRWISKIINPKKSIRSLCWVYRYCRFSKRGHGEGLGNKFLSNIRNTIAICQVVRCFDDENIIHVQGTVDPIRDIETINTELILADIEQ